MASSIPCQPLPLQPRVSFPAAAGPASSFAAALSTPPSSSLAAAAAGLAPPATVASSASSTAAASSSSPADAVPAVPVARLSATSHFSLSYAINSYLSSSDARLDLNSALSQQWTDVNDTTTATAQKAAAVASLLNEQAKATLQAEDVVALLQAEEGEVISWEKAVAASLLSLTEAETADQLPMKQSKELERQAAEEKKAGDADKKMQHMQDALNRQKEELKKVGENNNNGRAEEKSKNNCTSFSITSTMFCSSLLCAHPSLLLSFLSSFSVAVGGTVELPCVSTSNVGRS